MAGILFSHPDGSPMLRNEFDVPLKQLLGFVATSLVPLNAIISASGLQQQLRCGAKVSRVKGGWALGI